MPARALHGFVVAGLLGVCLASHAAWPPTTAGLVFVWENGNASNTVPTADGIGRLSRVVPTGGAVFNRFWAMDLAGGSFETEPDTNALLRDTYREAEALTVEAVLSAADRSADAREIVSFGLSLAELNAADACDARERAADACTQFGVVLGARAGNVVFGIAGPDSRGKRLLDAGAQLTERPTHVIATFESGRVAVYANGERTYAEGTRFDLSTTPDAALRFGAPEPWNGTVEGVALYARALTADEAAAHFAAYAPRLAGRAPLQALRVDARLVEKRPIPRAEVYPNSLVVYDYRVLAIAEGAYGEEKLLVAHRGNLNGRRNGAAADVVVGRRYALELEPFEAHPQLASLQMVGNDEDWHLPLFYAVSDPAASE